MRVRTLLLRWHGFPRQPRAVEVMRYLSGSAPWLQVFEIQIPTRSATITITSPDRGEAARLADGICMVGR